MEPDHQSGTTHGITGGPGEERPVRAGIRGPMEIQRQGGEVHSGPQASSHVPSAAGSVQDAIKPGLAVKAGVYLARGMRIVNVAPSPGRLEHSIDP